MTCFDLIKPILKYVPPEPAHKIALMALKTGLYRPSITQHKGLNQTLWGMEFKNPVGLAAGFDKNAEAIAPLLNTGFGFVEAGTVTPKSQSGNPKPRIFRNFEHKSVINAMGFPGGGIDVFKKNVEVFRGAGKSGILGINIGKNKTSSDPIEDYCDCVTALVSLADYMVINVSSPNTPGLRDLQQARLLTELLLNVVKTRDALKHSSVPILVKIAPDLDQKAQEDIVSAVLEAKVDGIIISNTTIMRPDILPTTFKKRQGGLSGALLFESSTQVLKNIYRLTNGDLPLIGVGGISSPQDVYTKIKSGASLTQLYSALVFQGPQLVTELLDGVTALMAKESVKHISEIIGVEA